MVLPSVLASRTSRAATVAAPTFPPQVLPTPASTTRATFTPAPVTVALDGQAKHVNPYTTQDQINNFFRIISPRPGSGT